MRTITKTINLYQYSELSEKAKEKVLSDLHNINTDYDWYDFIFDDFMEKCENLGITVKYSDIEFSGFWSQGDGACFTTNFIDIRKIIEVLKIEFRNDFLKNLFIDYFDTYKIIKLSNYYSHEYTVAVHYEDEFNYNHGGSYKRIADYLESKGEEIENKLESLKNQLCSKLYSDLQEEYEYLTSEEAIIETIEANEYEFTEEGEIY